MKIFTLWLKVILKGLLIIQEPVIDYCFFNFILYKRSPHLFKELLILNFDKYVHFMRILLWVAVQFLCFIPLFPLYKSLNEIFFFRRHQLSKIFHYKPHFFSRINDLHLSGWNINNHLFPFLACVSQPQLRITQITIVWLEET